MPNGNVLILAVTLITEAVQAQCNPRLIPEENLYNQQVIEITPLRFGYATIVWEWNIKDHLIKGYDITKDYIGNVDFNPNKLDDNFLNGLIGNTIRKSGLLHL